VPWWPSKVGRLDAELCAHGTKGAGLEFVLWVTHHGEDGTEVKRLMAALPREASSLAGRPRSLPSALTLRMNSFPVMPE
ncbi:hypothetical protein, partial [Metallibacterium sp.]|uniref:hypothetical protein n=1 Tax=Metallibacterium sp. TaxID=2940281 RepID=UPI00261A6B6B